ncbi:N-acetyltransferase [Caenispirillum bisanense]|uniref:N-acetyltransferase n=1 Tax=Caenispirillum bisanense TaxID=414052 RepID=UPI0031DD05FF
MMSDSCELIAVGAAHAGVLAVLHEAAFGVGEAWTTGDFAALFDTPGTFGWIAQVGTGQGPQPVALVLARAVADEAEILTIGSLPRARRRGIGRSLLRAAAAEAATRGAERLFLEVAVDNEAALGLYRAAGFTEVGRRKDYYRRPTGGSADALVMMRAVL